MTHESGHDGDVAAGVALADPHVANFKAKYLEPMTKPAGGETDDGDGTYMRALKEATANGVVFPSALGTRFNRSATAKAPDYMNANREGKQHMRKAWAADAYAAEQKRKTQTTAYETTSKYKGTYKSFSKQRHGKNKTAMHALRGIPGVSNLFNP